MVNIGPFFFGGACLECGDVFKIGVGCTDKFV